MAQRQTTEVDEITTTADILGTKEIEVDPVAPLPTPDKGGFVVVRMNTTLDDFTYGDPNQHWKLEFGKRYRMPVHIAEYLDALGYIWH